MLEFFNCDVVIVNRTRYPLILQGSPTNKHGDYSPAPPNSIAPGTSASFSLKHTNFSPYGTEGSCSYYAASTHGRGVIEFTFSCPSLTGKNSADAIFTAKQGTPPSISMIPNPIPEDGHPVEVQFIIQ